MSNWIYCIDTKSSRNVAAIGTQAVNAGGSVVSVILKDKGEIREYEVWLSAPDDVFKEIVKDAYKREREWVEENTRLKFIG